MDNVSAEDIRNDCDIVRRPVPLMPAMDAYRGLRATYGPDRAFLLESQGGPQEDNRVSMCGLAGRTSLIIRNGSVAVDGERDAVQAIAGVLVEAGVIVADGSAYRLVADDSLWMIPRILDAAMRTSDDRADLALSFLVFFGYDAVHYIERLPRSIPDQDDAPPDAVISFVDAIVTFEEHRGELAVVRSSVWGGEDPDRVEGALSAWSEENTSPEAVSGMPTVPRPRRIRDDVTREEYLRRGEVCLEHIRQGDAYQVQLGHSVTIETDADPLAVYERLRRRNPSPYMALFTVAGHVVVCASPELFVRLEKGSATMRPIAGTIARGADDAAQRAQLVDDPKERAEHLMLVDLCRNDLGRVARPGTLDVEVMMAVETYSHVLHLVSQVVCELEAGRDVWDVIRAGFPAGTMSGAPKVRAMEIIESLESTRRGLYAGAFGLVGLGSRPAVLGLAIRMAVVRCGTYVLRASAGFVADSTGDSEWEETLQKMAAPYWAVCGEEIR